MSVEQANVVRGALKFFDGGRRWTQGTYATRRDHVEYRCAVGALRRQKGYNNDYSYFYTPTGWQANMSIQRAISDVIHEQYPDRGFGGYTDIERFNDHNDTTFEDIERVFEKAIVKLEEEV